MANLKGNKNHILTFDEKKKLIKDYQKGVLSLRGLSIKYRISYSATRSICLGFETEGEEFLKKKSGNKTNHPKKSKERINSVDPKDREIARLRKQLADKEIEAQILKKLQALLSQKNKRNNIFQKFSSGGIQKILSDL